MRGCKCRQRFVTTVEVHADKSYSLLCLRQTRLRSLLLTDTSMPLAGPMPQCPECTSMPLSSPGRDTFSDAPSTFPSMTPILTDATTASDSPSGSPSTEPSSAPSDQPSIAPSDAPSNIPSESPSSAPTVNNDGGTTDDGSDGGTVGILDTANGRGGPDSRSNAGSNRTTAAILSTTALAAIAVAVAVVVRKKRNNTTVTDDAPTESV
jgi:hypothetical protein